MKREIYTHIRLIYMCVLYIGMYRLLLLPLPPLKSMTYKRGAVTALPKVARKIKKSPEGDLYYLMASLPSIGIDQRELLTVSVAHNV